ncbi:MAG: M1 family metallopeptidase [Saprospiraceae bacterium]
MRFCSLLFLLLATFSTVAQPPAAYFQQQVDVFINVTLDDENHSLSGDISMKYTNNSPDELSEIYLHLWANAYKNRTTAFAKQKLRQGSTKFYFAEIEELGNFSNLDFKVDGKAVLWNFTANDPDVAILELAQPLKSGATITISTPLNLQIPASFSRLGHVGESYQLTQWYPKPAVYDRDGWHPMPYLDMGEFYSEFGNYEVKITLPENYVVGATGEVQEESERQFLEQKAVETVEYLKSIESRKKAGVADLEEFPISSKTMKTLTFRAENVHDFAWFADKRFKVQKSSVQLASGREIDTWTMFTKAEEELWKTSIDYVNRSVKFYSDLVGEYPYPQATAVQSALSAGGGMEYPMITVIGLSGDAQSLDEVITHEVGHNWFYGILGFNERDHVWLDEGLNSYYDHRYTKQFYESESLDVVPNIFKGSSEMTTLEAGYIFQARRYQHQAPATHSNEFEYINYWLGGYEMPAVIFGHLEAYWGAEKFDPIMQGFYKEWEFKHPQPADLRQFLEEKSGENLGWLFDDFIESNKVLDYKISDVKNVNNQYEITIENVGDIPAPFPVSGLKGGQIVNTQWFSGSMERQAINFPQGDYDELMIDAQHVMLSVDWRNNRYSLRSVFKKTEPLATRFATSIENDKRSSLYYYPALAWNNYDKTLLGATVHNLSITPKRFEFSLTPLYGTVSKELRGIGGMRYNHFFRTGLFESISLSVGGRAFSYNYDFDYKDHDKYYKLAPQLSFQFRKRTPIAAWSHKLDYRFVQIWQDYVRGIDFAEREFVREQRDYFVNELKYVAERENALSPLNIETVFHQGEGFTKLFSNYNQRFIYNRNKKAIYLHGFAGAFFDYTEPTASSRFLISGITGSNIFQRDYLFEELLLGRNDGRGIWSNQIFDRDANLRTISNIGSSADWMIGIGLAADLPIGIPLRPYIDAAIYPDAFVDEVNFTYSGGFAIPIVNDIFEIYLPFINSKDIKNGVKWQEREDENNFVSFFRRVTFKLDFTKLNPVKVRDGFEL